MPSNFEIFKHFTKGVHVIFCLSSRHNFQNYPASYPSKWTNPSPAKCFILHPTIKISVIPHPASKPVLDTPLYISHDVQYLSLNVIKQAWNDKDYRFGCGIRDDRNFNGGMQDKTLGGRRICSFWWVRCGIVLKIMAGWQTENHMYSLRKMSKDLKIGWHQWMVQH